MINMLTLRPGDRLSLRGGLVAEVTENMQDGMWVEVKYVEVPDNSEAVGAIELCHAQDIMKLLEVAR